MGLGKIFTKKCVQSHIFSQGKLSWVFDRTWKVSTKRWDQLHIFFAVQTILSFWWDLESFDKKLWPVAPFWQYRLSQVFDGTWKNFHKEVCPVTRCVRCGDYLKFWMGLRKVSTKMCAQLHVFAAQKNYLEFLRGLGKFRQKGVSSHTFFRRADYLEFLRGLGKFRQKGVSSHTFFRRADYLEFLRRLGKFRQIAATSCTFLAVQTILSFWRGSENFPQKCVPSYTFFRCGD